MKYDKLFECCGCEKCSIICPRRAISMHADKTGFVYPVIDREKCVYCNKCNNSCMFHKHVNNLHIETKMELEIYAAINKNEQIRLDSRSGGIFTSISDIFLQNKDIVYGCLLDDNWKVKHSRATDVTTRDKFRGSKYVQSNISNSFFSVQEDLQKGNRVLFSGTPCQVDALQSYVNNKEKLYTIDIVCYGVASPQVWSDYIQYIQRKFCGTVEYFDFRDKLQFGWKAHKESFVINGEKFWGKEFTHFFQKKVSLRPSCFRCPYKSLTRVSDITLGDFWGIDKVCPEFSDNKGVSLVIINTDKGRGLFNKIKNSILYIKVPIEKCIQPSLVASEKMPDNYKDFWYDYFENGISFVIKKYGNTNIE